MAHDAVILLFRYVCEGLGEDHLLAITKATTVTNASVTHLTRPSGQGFWKARTAGERADAVLIGPGLDEAEQTAELLELLLPVLRNETRVVLDAFALGVLDQVGAATKVAGRLVLTPNLAEAARLLGDKDREIEDLDRAVTEIAERFSAVVTCQGRIADADGGLWEISTGHGGLGTSGSGDVLAGALTGLLARGAAPDQAACWATHLHAAAGDRLTARVGAVGFLAGELVDELPIVLTELDV